MLHLKLYLYRLFFSNFFKILVKFVVTFYRINPKNFSFEIHKQCRKKFFIKFSLLSIIYVVSVLWNISYIEAYHLDPYNFHNSILKFTKEDQPDNQVKREEDKYFRNCKNHENDTHICKYELQEMQERRQGGIKNSMKEEG